MNVISDRRARSAVVAALTDRENICASARPSLAKTRRELCAWLRERNVKYIEPHANFMMIDCGRNAREFISAMPKLGVAPGRPFPPLDNMLRVTIGTDPEMAKFRDVFWKVKGLELRFDASFGQQIGDVQARGPSIDVLPVEVGVLHEDASDVPAIQCRRIHGLKANGASRSEYLRLL